MNPTVTAALIGFGGTVFTAMTAIVTQIILNKRNREKRKVENEEERKRIAVADALKDERLEQRMKAIEEKLDIHNGYAEKLQDVNKQLGEIRTDVAFIKGQLETN